jgi:hypothetical protein
MHAQILVEGELEAVVGRVTDAVVTVLADLAAELTDPALRSAMGALVVAARGQLAQAPIDPEPLVRAVLRGDPVALPTEVKEVEEVEEVEPGAVPTADPPGAAVSVDTATPSKVVAPAYWPAVPAISDELFAEYAAQSPQPGADPAPDAQPTNPAPDAQPTNPAPAPAATHAPEAELAPAHEGRFHPLAIRGRKKSHQR